MNLDDLIADRDAKQRRLDMINVRGPGRDRLEREVRRLSYEIFCIKTGRPPDGPQGA